MQWNEVTRIEVSGSTLVAKDAMVMLDADQAAPEWPAVTCSPGEHILEIHVPTPFHAHRCRIRRVDSNPSLGALLGAVEIDHGFVEHAVSGIELVEKGVFQAVLDDRDAA